MAAKNVEFINKVCDILGENFFHVDMIWQEDLFEMQDSLAKTIVDYSNNGSSLATHMVKRFPKAFYTE